MTREEIVRSLHRIRTVIAAGTPEAQGVVAALALIVTDQERRLRALEPCPRNDGGPHVWLSSGVCGYCEVRR